ncbi:MAG: hypothetical protein O2968_01360 [Acidobacteria bacterium]|nr:hypothetical protein [Acidobacteriota bacterium]
MEPGKRVRAEAPPEASEQSNLEAIAIAGNKLKQYRRDNTVKTHLHCATILGFWAFVLGVLGIGLVWFWHLVTPECWHYLSQSQEGEIKTILVTAITSAAMTRAAKKLFGGQDD